MRKFWRSWKSGTGNSGEGMSIYWNARTRQLQPYIPGEQPKDRKFIKLNTNENPYPPSPLVIEAIQKAADDRLRLYPDPSCMELREAAAARYGVGTEQVFAGNGSDEILAFAFAAFFGRKKEGDDNCLFFPDITYSFYPVYADLWGIPFRTIPLEPDFSIDISKYIEVMSLGQAGGIIFPNPNAPTGIAIPLEELKKTAEAAWRNKLVLVVDEAYIAFADAEGVSAAIPLIKNYPNLLIVRTLSKEASLAGLRVGFAMGSEELIEGLCKVRDSFNSYTLDRLALAGASAALKDAAYYDEMNKKVIATRCRVALSLEALGFRILQSQANFVFAAPPENCGRSGQEFFAALREFGILTRHFNKPRIAEFLRISMGTDDEMDILLEACTKIIGH